MRFLLVLTSFLTFATAQEGPSGGKGNFGKPALVTTEALKEFETLPEDRKELISKAIQVAKDSQWLPYKFGGSSPEDGGFDCSGAMFYVLTQVGIDPPRSSAAQFLWLKDEGRLHEISPNTRDLDDNAMEKLTPGDLLFWGGTKANGYGVYDFRLPNEGSRTVFMGYGTPPGIAAKTP